MEEIWKDIEGYEGLYQVSNLGRIRGLDRYLSVERYGKTYNRFQKGSIVKKQKSTCNYNQVQLHKGNEAHTYPVYKLVANAFISNPENKPCVDHINTDRNDDRACNLRWVTYKENANNPLTMKKYLGRDGNPQLDKRKPVSQFTKDGVFIKKWVCARVAAKELGITKSNIQSVAEHRPHFHTAGGYKWEYA